MINLFFRNRRKGENALDLSEIKIIGVGNGGTNVINHLQTHGVKEDSLWACDMDGSVIERAVTTHCLLLTGPYKVGIVLCLIFLVQVYFTRHFQSLPPNK